MTVGQRLQQIRQQTALSQEEFGEMLGVSRQTVSKWELDQTVPEISKIVLISRLFSVTTDSILIEGITSFDDFGNDFVCGIYKSDLSETVITEKFALVYYCTPDKSILGAKLYVGYGDRKLLRAICIRNKAENKTCYAYVTAEDQVYTNDRNIKEVLGEAFDPKISAKLMRRERFLVNKTPGKLPKVSDVGIAKALQSWRMCSKYYSNAEHFFFSLCTENTEYIFSIDVDDENIYCGASNNWVFDLGLCCGGQYFRIRNYKDNSRPFCTFFCDFSYAPKNTFAPYVKCEIGEPCNTENGLIFTVKEYNDDRIVLAGCNGDEYVYTGNDIRSESYVVLK